MKKTLILGFVAIILGLIVGNFLHNGEVIASVFEEGNSYYFLQEGVYQSKEAMEENTKKLDPKTIDYREGKYYVYLGITRSEKNANKMKKIYEEKGYPIYIKEQNISNEEFYNNVSQFDLLIENTTEEEEILTIEEVVLANYEQVMQKE